MQNPKSQQSARVFSMGVFLSLLVSAFFFWVWYDRYLKIEFNELGRYYDLETQIVYKDSAFVWFLPAFGFLLLSAVVVTYRIWRRKAKRAPENA